MCEIVQCNGQNEQGYFLVKKQKSKKKVTGTIAIERSTTEKSVWGSFQNCSNSTDAPGIIFI